MNSFSERLEKHQRDVLRSFERTAYKMAKFEGSYGARKTGPVELYTAASEVRQFTEPSNRDVHVSGPLTSFGVSYSNANYISERLFPLVPVVKQSGLYYEISQGDWLRDEIGVRGPGGFAGEAQYSVTTSPYNTVERAIAKVIPFSVVENSDTAIRPLQRAAQFVVEKTLLG